MADNIYNGDPLEKQFKTISGYDRLDINDDVISDMNVYRNWGGFVLKDEPLFKVFTRTVNGQLQYYIPEVVENGEVKEKEKIVKPEEVYYTHSEKKYNLPQRLGVRSLFNAVNAVNAAAEYSVHNNAPLIDEQQIRSRMQEYGDCSIKALVDASRAGKMGVAVYDYSDFMFCKYLGQVSNNYMVTLRRFPYPAGDHINLTMHGTDENENNSTTDDLKGANHHMPDMGRLITWMGTPGNNLEDILKYNVLMPYEELQSQIEQVSGNSETGGIMGAICASTSSSYAHKVEKGLTGSNTISALSGALGHCGSFGRFLGGNIVGPPHEPSFFQDRTKSYGPVDVIAKTHIRRPAQNGGLDFNQEISLVFDYELRSYDNINTRAAFLDLIGNILAVTYTNATFWKGMYAGSGTSAGSLFSNLPIYNIDFMNASFNDITDAALGTVAMIGQALNDGKPVTKGSDLVHMVVNAAKNLLGMLAGGMLNKLGRPQRQGVNSLLSDAPVGLWHLTIGNPKHPIMSMGNMILDSVEINHYGQLGLDDFPTGLRVNIKLKHAMPRDAQKIEQMYLMGDYRIYQPMDEDIVRIYGVAENAGKLQDQDRLTQVERIRKQKADDFRALTKNVGNFLGKPTKEILRKTADFLRNDSQTKSMAEEAKNISDGATTKMRRGFGLAKANAGRLLSGVKEFTWGNNQVIKKKEESQTKQ